MIIDNTGKRVEHMTSEELVAQGKHYRAVGRFDEAYKSFLEAALNNSSEAIKNLGRCYLHGEGVQQDYDKALYYFDMAKAIPSKGNSEYDDAEYDEDRRYNFHIGLEPMERNVFKCIVVDVLKVMTDREDYLSIAYCSTRGDRVSCIQSHPEENCDLHYVEIVIEDNNDRGFRIYAKEDLSLLDTIGFYRKILVDYELFDISDWEDVTEKVPYEAEK